MCRSMLWLVAACVAWAQPKPPGAGRPATAEEIKDRDITVFPDGRGLPAGKGTAGQGEKVYKSKCAVCHNDKGEGRERQYPALVGGIGSLAAQRPVKTVGSYWPYATTVWDYINRSMPFDHPRTLSADEVYAVTAFVLHLNGIVDAARELNERTLPQVLMPNRNGFVPDQRPDVKAKR
ncbi:MAG: cytochrome c [Acidobacteria bacterium]|nr:cytochrome c [Acidobacteriota bacterium]